MINKKLLLSLLTVGMIAAVAGAGTWASYIDTETSTENTLTAATMDLQLSSGGDYAQGLTGAFSLGPSGVYPGASGTLGTIYVKNVGEVPGKLTWTSSYTDDENGFTEPELAIDPTKTGDLGSVVTMSYFNGETELNPTTGIDIAAGAVVPITVKFSVSADADNRIQTDKATYNFAFTLAQNTL